MTITVGMAVNTGEITRAARHELANVLEAAIPYADHCKLWFDGRPAVSTLSALVMQLRRTLQDEVNHVRS